MKPEGDDILRLAGLRLTTTVAPLMSQFFALGQVALISSMLGLVGQEYERGADMRASENGAIRKLFSELSPLVGDAALKSRLEAAARSTDTSLLISALNAANYELRRLLSNLHAHVETLEGVRAREAEKQIWSLLKRIAERRMVKLNTQL